MESVSKTLRSSMLDLPLPLKKPPIERINNKHQATLPVVLIDRHLTKEIKLDGVTRNNPVKIHPCLLVAVPIPVHGIECFEGIGDQLRGKGCGIGYLEREGIRVLRDVGLKTV